MDRKEFEYLIEEARRWRLSAWEIEFLDDIEDLATNPFWEPTERQWERLREIEQGTGEADDDR
jgi:hypothetical protein